MDFPVQAIRRGYLRMKYRFIRVMSYEFKFKVLYHTELKNHEDTKNTKFHKVLVRLGVPGAFVVQ